MKGFSWVLTPVVMWITKKSSCKKRININIEYIYTSMHEQIESNRNGLEGLHKVEMYTVTFSSLHTDCCVHLPQNI